ncbi:nucleotidyltransferase-like protein [Scopulibacillus darangshiensis]|uniref:Nucleotidyltransferase-like protein n=1 Tax=Scopulibacillus darangshiensis TaxID=442528 RepID=A0A4R2P4N5_9BACL|nr:nucleotidyltransferase domain-containing protein [Scopulibacillus darangshiensis]TCP29722.1 nucleotidyltransferase-like protein [Scopulibacillus darangshiensis]
MMYGLLERDFYYIKKALDKFSEIDQAILFGSRALGNYKKGSDIDLAIVGDDISDKTMADLYEWLNDIYPLPYMIDLQNYNSITNENLKNHIDTCGKELYQKQEDSRP